MSEIEKLYENANVEKKYDCSDCEYLSEYICPKCSDKQLKYPEFTAEKQLELIKWLAENKIIEISKQFIELKNNRNHCVSRRGLKFEESLAKLVNLIWQSLSDTEKAEIKRILE